MIKKIFEEKLNREVEEVEKLDCQTNNTLYKDKNFLIETLDFDCYYKVTDLQKKEIKFFIDKDEKFMIENLKK